MEKQLIEVTFLLSVSLIVLIRKTKGNITDKPRQ